jgi:hypothetical protein
MILTPIVRTGNIAMMLKVAHTYWDLYMDTGMYRRPSPTWNKKRRSTWA